MLFMIGSAPAQETEKQAKKPAPTVLNSGWNVQCNTVNSDLVCIALIDVTYVKNKSRLLRVAIQPSENGKKNVTMQLPLGLHLPFGVALSVDNTKIQDVVIQTCTQQGCFARTDYTEEFGARLKKGNILTVALQSNQQQEIRVELPLKGFTKAVEKIQ